MGDRSHAKIHQYVDALLADPVTALAMQADGVESTSLHILLSRTFLATYRSAKAYSRAPTGYRRGVGIALFDSIGRVLIARRIDVADGGWQFPQGGIDPGETLEEAAKRELLEEIGTSNAEIVSDVPGWLRYDLPENLLGKTWGGAWRGQRQRWLAMRFVGQDADINVATHHPEFAEWRWAELADVPALIVDFKRPVYEKVCTAFAAFAGPVVEAEARVLAG